LQLVPYQRRDEGWLTSAVRMQDELWAGLEHRAVSALSVMRMLAARRGTAAASMPVVFTSTLGVASDLARLSFAFGRYVGGVSQTPQVWLDNQVVENEGELLVNWDAVEGIFAEGVLDAMFGAYRELLAWLAATPAWDGAMPTLLPAGQQGVRAAVNATAGRRVDAVLHAGLFAWAAEAPARVAVAWGAAETWSYAEVARQALQVAAWLQGQGVAAGAAVAVSLAKGPDQIVAVLGVLAAGGVYVPVSPTQPAARQERIRASAGARVVVDAAALAAARQGPGLARPVAVAPTAVAYVIYTSGSTGEPKGVEITHAAAMNTIAALNARYGVGPTDRVLAVSALDFDLSVYDVFGLLTAGGGVVVLDEETRRDAQVWATRVRQWRVTVWNSVPTLLEMLVTAARPADLASLRVVFVSGDWIGVELPPRVKAVIPSCTFVAMGGATEGSIWSNAIDVDAVPAHWKTIPYGFPLPNQQYRVVDERGRDCPDWVIGELWIGGAGVAEGYRGNAAATASRFVSVAGTRWYRTGDLGRYWPDGTLEFLGRADFQVKIRGHRIELGEIEAALASGPGVRQAVALAYGPGRQQLGAAVVGAVDAADVRRHVEAIVPSYMVPERVLVLPALPLSANGKVDRGRLTTWLTAAAPAAGAAAPTTAVEQHLATLWRELLGHAVIGRDDNFFALGGDSLLATRLVEEARVRFGLDLPLRDIFSSATLASLAASVIDNQGGVETGSIE
ncbi:MAG TPA: amino acid adenylation domain-containing protein, partial [Dongiaceae bacterium]|nr:amino acid adenylation domain-containing protein [Dongiaceae bacterium]